MKILFETDKLRIENEFEATFLIDKSTGEILLEDDFYGDPQCGLIDKDNNWAIVAGEHLTIWTPEKWKRIEDEELKSIHDIRLKQENIVEILTDPWSKKSAIWELHIDSLKYRKISDFDKYKSQEYTDNVVW